MDMYDHRISDLERKYRELESKAHSEAFQADSEKQQMKRKVAELQTAIDALTRKLQELGR